MKFRYVLSKTLIVVTLIQIAAMASIFYNRGLDIISILANSFLLIFIIGIWFIDYYGERKYWEMYTRGAITRCQICELNRYYRDKDKQNQS